MQMHAGSSLSHRGPRKTKPIRHQNVYGTDQAHRMHVGWVRVINVPKLHSCLCAVYQKLAEERILKPGMCSGQQPWQTGAKMQRLAYRLKVHIRMI